MATKQGSTIRTTIERERVLLQDDNKLMNHPNVKLFKQILTEDFQLPIGYNGLTVGLEVPNGVNLTIPGNSKLVSL